MANQVEQEGLKVVEPLTPAEIRALLASVDLSTLNEVRKEKTEAAKAENAAFTQKFVEANASALREVIAAVVETFGSNTTASSGWTGSVCESAQITVGTTLYKVKVVVTDVLSTERESAKVKAKK